MGRYHHAPAWVAIAPSLVLAMAACSAAPALTPGSTPSPQPSASQSPGSGAPSQAELKYRLIDRFGALWYCDPDEYPVAHGDEQELAQQRLPEIRRDAETYAAIAARLEIDPLADLEPAETLAVYRAWKMLNALVLEPDGSAFSFEAIFTPALDADEGTHVVGQVAPDGTIAVDHEAASGPPPCPICLVEGARIATPDGEVPIERLTLGSPVLTVDANGKVIVATILRIGSAAAPPHHQVVRMTLADGRSVRASPGHPLADGTPIGSIQPGDAVDGSVVRSVIRMQYRHARTYDLLPSGETGAYWADGILLGSTLER